MKEENERERAKTYTNCLTVSSAYRFPSHFLVRIHNLSSPLWVLSWHDRFFLVLLFLFARAWRWRAEIMRKITVTYIRWFNRVHVLLRLPWIFLCLLYDLFLFPTTINARGNAIRERARSRMVHIVNLTEFNSPPNSSSTSYHLLPPKIKNNNNKLQGSLASSDQEDKLDLGGNFCVLE